MKSLLLRHCATCSTHPYRVEQVEVAAMIGKWWSNIDRTSSKKRGEHHEMETDVIALATQFDAIHPDNGRIVKVVGIDGSSAFSPKLIVMVTDVTGTHVEALDYVKNKRPGA
ncbi:hypothetical protein [Mesorhizobium sp.]|uniref:hypothetical protein n=1 Tax=Mesorhizobium sp. TaxID=1871066 RepID=UPI000FE31863|nr:hypothetical protein [Mesorhizobium sp.]RWN99376.1 MAG: hypothetical protein EOS06_18470 [Mesorhizobium sp.]